MQMIRPRRPILVFIDFEAAFPSISRAFLRESIRSMGLPAGMQKVLDALYAPSWAQTSRSCVAQGVGFRVCSGIPQGCPLSGSVYAATSTALMHLLTTEIQAECIFMFADDLALLLDDVERLPAIAKILNIYARATNLKVKVGKTVIVPLRVHEHDFDRVIQEHKNVIRDHLPEWSTVKVAMQARHVRHQVGPSATRDMQWSGALEEHTKRVRQTVAGGAAPSFNIRHYNTYVAALCTYIGSMYRAPLHLHHHF